MEPILEEFPAEEEIAEWIVQEDEQRLDVFCAAVSGLTRSRIEGLCQDQAVLVNGKAQKKNYKLKKSDRITLILPENREIDAQPQEIPLNVVYEDSDIIVIDKPAGLVVHPAPGNPDGTLVNALLWHCGDSLSGINGKIRPGIVHRLDKDTSGLILCAKNDAAHIKIAEDIKEHRYIKKYQALIYGHLKEKEGRVDLAIGRSRSDRKKMAAYPLNSPNAKNASTRYRVLEEWEGYSLVELTLETGRTHQIRVHLQALGHPVVGDPLYAAGRPTLGLSGQCLHACELTIRHPVTDKQLHFVSPLPEHFQKALGKIR